MGRRSVMHRCCLVVTKVRRQKAEGSSGSGAFLPSAFCLLPSDFCYAPALMALFSSKEPASTPSRPGEPQPAFHGTYLGPNVVIDGTVSGSEAVVVEGTIKGRINVTNDLRIGTKARV